VHKASVISNIIRGGCSCGAVRYEAAGEPYNVTHCHCQDCRHGSAAAFVTWATFRRAGFRFIRGDPLTRSCAGRLRSFCPACGTPLTFLSEPETEEIDVTVCSFDRPDAVSPADHTWVSDALPWTRRDDALPAYARERPNRDA